LVIPLCSPIRIEGLLISRILYTRWHAHLVAQGARGKVVHVWWANMLSRISTSGEDGKPDKDLDWINLFQCHIGNFTRGHLFFNRYNIFFSLFGPII